MKKVKQLPIIIFLLLMILCTTLGGCGNNSVDDPKEISHNNKVLLLNKEEIQARDSKAKEGVEFQSQDFYFKLRDFNNKVLEYSVNDNYDKNSNIAISPVSIYFCLAMASEIVDEEARNEILNAFDMDYDDLAKSKELFNQLIIASYEEDTLVSALDLTNSIWLENSKIDEIDKDVLSSLSDKYKCFTYAAPFKNKNDLANQKFTEFVRKQTNNLINKEFNFSNDTLAVLLNTLYLKDVWEDPLFEENKDFTNANGEIENASFLHGNSFNLAPVYESNYSFASTYTTNFKLTFILPNEEIDVLDIYNKDTLNHVVNYTYEKTDKDNKYVYETRCIFPKFIAKNEIDLVPLLKNHFGVNKMFQTFTCKLNNAPCCIDEAKHDTCLIVNEKGIEGAAITYMAIKENDIGNAINYNFELNKPFAYVIEANNGVVLFSGICNTTK